MMLHYSQKICVVGWALYIFIPIAIWGFLKTVILTPLITTKVIIEKASPIRLSLVQQIQKKFFATYVNKQADRIDQVTLLINSETRFLELGASAGQFIHHVLGKCASLSAVELDEDCKLALEKIPGVRVSGEPLGSSEFYGSVFDVICAFQVLEHIPDPVSFLQEIYSCLAPGGWAFVEVPNLYDPLLSVWNIEEYKDFYYHEDHLLFFRPSAVTLRDESRLRQNQNII